MTPKLHLAWGKGQEILGHSQIHAPCHFKLWHCVLRWLGPLLSGQVALGVALLAC